MQNEKMEGRIGCAPAFGCHRSLLGLSAKPPKVINERKRQVQAIHEEGRRALEAPFEQSR